jgi:hypothetical protein
VAARKAIRLFSIRKGTRAYMVRSESVLVQIQSVFNNKKNQLLNNKVSEKNTKK